MTLMWAPLLPRLYNLFGYNIHVFTPLVGGSTSLRWWRLNYLAGNHSREPQVRILRNPVSLLSLTTLVPYWQFLAGRMVTNMFEREDEYPSITEYIWHVVSWF